MEINMEWLGCSDGARRDLEKFAKASVVKFFKHCHVPVVTLIGLKATRGANGNQLIKILTERPEYALRPGFIPVLVFLEGRQGLECHIGISERSSLDVKKLIDGGPYKTKSRDKVEDGSLPAEVSPAVPSTSEVTAEVRQYVDTAAVAVAQTTPERVVPKATEKVIPTEQTSRKSGEYAGARLEQIQRLIGQLANLSRGREQEVHKRLIGESRQEESPPIAAASEAAIQNGFLPDNSIFELATSTLQGRKQAEMKVVQAQGNLDSLGKVVAELAARLKTAQDEFNGAQFCLTLAERYRDEFIISPEVLQKVREAKARYDRLAADLGL